MQATDRFINAFTILGDFLGQSASGQRKDTPGLDPLNREYFEPLQQLIEDEHAYNAWFTPEYVRQALAAISAMLEREVLQKWLSRYSGETVEGNVTRSVGLVLAGNIPLVGFHDMMCVLAAGHRVVAKPSSKDDRLIRKIAELLTRIDPLYGERIRFTDERLKGVDAVIATGSNNSSRYFEYYFREMPHIIRKNRNGVAVLNGEEREEELAGIGKDIFTYFGLGCRNVTKIYIPESYDPAGFLKVMDRFHHLYQHHKYGNNVDYYRTIYLMNRIPFLDNGVLLLKEDPAIASPVGVVFYERYSEIGWVLEQLMVRKEEIQCCVSVHPGIPDALPPGSTQEPMPWDYADGVDTIRFLKALS